MASSESLERLLSLVCATALLSACAEPSPPPPVIETASPLPAAIVGRNYTVDLNASGGKRPLSWTTGTPPAGLRLSADSGRLSGKPERPGSSCFKVSVQDAVGRSDTRLFDLRVTLDPALEITTERELPQATVAQPYSQRLEALGASGSLAWSSSNLSDDFRLDAGKGIIHGTPLRAGHFTFDVKLSDGAEQCAVKRLVLTVSPPVATESQD